MITGLLWLLVVIGLLVLSLLLAFTAQAPRGHRPSHPMRKGPPPHTGRKKP